MTDQEFISTVGGWATLNFTYHNPWFGMVEETGEAVHCLLKREQKIRGYDNSEFFRVEFADALSDIAVYAAHYAYLCPEAHMGFCLDEVTPDDDQTTEKVVAQLLQTLAEMQLGPTSEPALTLRSVLALTSILAELENLNLREITFATWDRVVAKRNWVKSPVRGVEIRDATEKEMMEDNLKAPFMHLEPVNPTREMHKP
jgi:hypothetical protein